jgi:hypothetical protein
MSLIVDGLVNPDCLWCLREGIFSHLKTPPWSARGTLHEEDQWEVPVSVVAGLSGGQIHMIFCLGFSQLCYKES